MSLDDDPAPPGPNDEASSGGTDDEGLPVSDPGPVAEVAGDEGGSGAELEGSDSGHQRGLAERWDRDQGSLGALSYQEQYPPVGPNNVEVVGYSWNSPLPPARELQGYESVVAGSAERIISMAETAVKGPIEDRSKLTNAEIEAGKRGLNFAMVLTGAMATIAVAFLALAVAGVNRSVALAAGGICLSLPVVMLIRSFITRS